MTKPIDVAVAVRDLVSALNAAGDLIERLREEAGCKVNLRVWSFDGHGVDVYDLNGELEVKVDKITQLWPEPKEPPK